jgi:hypothetical protein
LNPVIRPAASVVNSKIVEPSDVIAELLESIVTSPSVKLNDSGMIVVAVLRLAGRAVATVKLPVMRQFEGQVADPKNCVNGLPVYV